MNKRESIKIRIVCELLDKAKRDSDVIGIGLSEHIRSLLQGLFIGLESKKGNIPATLFLTKSKSNNLNPRSP